jgi:predicted helicase
MNPVTREDAERLRRVQNFTQLVKYLREELEWPYYEFEDPEEVSYDWSAEELGIDKKNAAAIEEIRQLRPPVGDWPWGIFYVKFEKKRLPITVLRRALASVVSKKREAANTGQRWAQKDLLFISSFGEGDKRQISFARFQEPPSDLKRLPTLKVLAWDEDDTDLSLEHTAGELRTKLAWPEDHGENIEAWRERWSSAFTRGHRETVHTSKELASELARLAQRIRKRIRIVLALESEKGPIKGLMAAFQQSLVHDLNEDGFADMYAQTIAYGLFSARVTSPSSGDASQLLSVPVTNPFLRELMGTFLEVGGRKDGNKGPGIDFDELGINDVVELLDATNMEAVLRDFGDKNPLEDPVIHFFEGFLQEYDNKIKKARGVFYTPRPIVSFIVRSVDELLRTEFGIEDGLADTTTWGEMAGRIDDLKIPEGTAATQAFVQILDPATGTGTFLVEVIDLIHKTMNAKWRAEGYGKKEIEKLWNAYVPEHLLPRLHGYELMMAPYAIAHMKIGLKLYETGYRFESDERARVYLTNALEPAQDFSGTLAFAIPALAHEAEAVNAIKRDQRFTVVIGNPPYSRATSNTGAFIEKLMERYKTAVRSERNIQPLSDDYIKFLCFSHHVLTQVPLSIMGMITNSTYISGRIHRGVREEVQRDFPLAMIANLHGNTRIGVAGGGSPADDNVFDIMQGVAISLWVRGSPDTPSFLYRDLVGSREHKYKTLSQGPIKHGEWSPLRPSSPYFLWIKRGEDRSVEFSEFAALNQIFRYSSVSGKPGDDNLLVSFDQGEVIPKLKAFRKADELDRGRLTEAGRKLANLDDGAGFKKSAVSRYAYRPFDDRWTYYDPAIWTRALTRLRSHANGQPILLTTKLIKDSFFSHVFVTRGFPDVIHLSNKSSVNCYSFPLGAVADAGSLNFDTGGEASNLDVSGFGNPTRFDWDTDSAFCWIYAVLHSALYRARYFELLQYDFPRIPVKGNSNLILSLTKLGRSLVSCHLLESPNLGLKGLSDVGPGPMQVEKVSYSDETVWIDKARTRGFKGVPEEVWNFHIGGYQVCEKWLKDRQAKGVKNPRPGRVLTDEDIEHYQKIVVALSETIRIMAEIDEVIEAHGGWPGAFMTDSSATEG